MRISTYNRIRSISPIVQAGAICAIFLTLSLKDATAASDGRILMTVNGPIPTEEMGVTLPHEHVIVDWGGAEGAGYHRWDRAEVVDVVLPYLLEIKERGYETFFELTPAYLGRDPFLLKILADKSGLNIVTNTGFYGARDNFAMPSFAWEKSAEEIAERWIDEFENGIHDSDIRPGFIKIAIGREAELSPQHEKIVRAAALTHLATGLTIVSHTGPDGPAFAQISIFEEMGVDLSAFVWTHAQHGTFDAYLKAAEKGVWISIDNMRDSEDRTSMFVDRLTRLKEAGFLHQVLISHDAGWYTVGEEGGGSYRGYTAIHDILVPALKKVGFTDEDFHTLLVKNPAKAYGLNLKE